MFPGTRSGSEVEGSGSPNAVAKVSSKVGVLFEEVVDVVGVVLVELRGPAGERLGSEARDSPERLVLEQGVQLFGVSIRVLQVSWKLAG